MNFILSARCSSKTACQCIVIEISSHNASCSSKSDKVPILNCLLGAFQRKSKVRRKFGKYRELIAFYNIHFSFINLSVDLSPTTKAPPWNRVTVLSRVPHIFIAWVNSISIKAIGIWLYNRPVSLCRDLNRWSLGLQITNQRIYHSASLPLTSNLLFTPSHSISENLCVKKIAVGE